MVVYKSYAASEYEQAAQTAAQYLEDAGIFESVTLSGTTITCTRGGETVAAFAYSNGQVNIEFGPYTLVIGDQQTLWIGKATNGVLLNSTNQWIQGGNAIYTLAICKSTGGVPMLIYRQPTNIAGQPGSYLALTCDAPSAPSLSSALGVTTNAVYSNLAGICTVSTAETVAAADRVYQYMERQNGIALNSIGEFTFAETSYMTDGWIAVKD